MTLLAESRSRLSGDPSVLSAIRDEGCNLAVWQRAPFADFAPLVAGEPKDLRFIGDPASLGTRLLRELASGGFGGGAALHHVLAEDAAHLGRLFCAAMDLALLELRLEVVRTDSCRKFHADYVTARLITTYVGEGTHWLADEDAARLAAGGEPRRIHRLAPFDVGLFKGKLATGNPVIHRSPPIAGTDGGARLLLVLNPASPPRGDVAQSPLPARGHMA
ncbi:DUF1826 domain-containing protein [Erythrobacter sp. NE805]|uniref:DUF1826 domain-containing protein n=1 Tax=Erythrobacter sp. NE805 TaxID=3389875 RepID=UPI00396B3D37